MGRIGLNLDEKLLRKTIEEAEQSQTFENRSILFQYVVDKLKTCPDEKGNIKPLTISVIDNRVRKFNIELKTPKGKIGTIGTTVRPKKEDSFRRRPEFKVSETALKQKFKDKPVLAKKILNGSMQAAIKANCYECCGFDAKEAGRCVVLHCPFYHFNPYINHDERTKDGKLKSNVAQVSDKDDE